jgi:hypothetical protein
MICTKIARRFKEQVQRRKTEHYTRVIPSTNEHKANLLVYHTCIMLPLLIQKFYIRTKYALVLRYQGKQCVCGRMWICVCVCVWVCVGGGGASSGARVRPFNKYTFIRYTRLMKIYFPLLFKSLHIKSVSHCAGRNA